MVFVPLLAILVAVTVADEGEVSDIAVPEKSIPPPLLSNVIVMLVND